MTRATQVASIAFAAASFGVLGAALLVTQAVAAGAPPQLRLLFRPLCHGLESRCFHFGGVPMPICARCTGLYIGFLIGIGLVAAVRKLHRIRIPSALVIGLVAPLAIDGVTQAIGFRTSTNELRLFSGVLAGTAALAWVMNRIQTGDRDRIAVEASLS